MSTPYSFTPPAKQRTFSRRALVAVIVIMFIILAGAILLVRWNAIGRAVGPSCTIGVTGTAANITVQGWGADSSCHSMLGAHTYDLRSGPQGVVVCQYVIHSDLVTVRDEGLLKLVGAALCSKLQQESPSSTS